MRRPLPTSQRSREGKAIYGKIFDSIYDGTLAEDWRALVTFQQLIVLCDADGVVDMTPGAISRRTGIPIEHIKAGLEILEQPDPYSRTADHEGRRIMPIDDERPWGWFLVNHEKYRSFQDADTVRAGNRERKRRQREKEQEARGVTDESHDVTDGHGQSRHTDTDTDTDTENQHPVRLTRTDSRFDEFWEVWPTERKRDKKKARDVWKRKKLDRMADTIIADVRKRQTEDNQWLRGYVPLPTTYLNGDRWEDVIEAPSGEQETNDPFAGAL